MKAIWTGTARSSSRVDRETGQPIQYRLTVYDDGDATCSCPSFVFQGTRRPLTVAAGQAWRCKHLAPLFSSGAFRAPDQGSEIPETLQAQAGTSPPEAPSGDPLVGDPDFPDDDFDVAPASRR